MSARALIFSLAIGQAVLITGCHSYKGHRKYFDRARKDCELKILMALPPDKNNFEKIGVCRGRGANMIDDGSEQALKRISKCACRHGGNAVVISEKTTGFTGQDYFTGLWSTTNTGKFYTGIVIRLKEFN